MTPAKLSRAAKSTMIGATGAKGDTGSTGPQGRTGDRGVPGLPGTTGGEPFVADASGEVADLKITSPVDVPLDGTTSWTSTAGEAGLLFGKLDATLATEPGGGFSCEVSIQVFVDGIYAGFFGAQNSQQSFAESSRVLTPIPVAVHESGTHTISAKAFFGTSQCQSGSKLDSLQLIVAGLGA